MGNENDRSSRDPANIIHESKALGVSFGHVGYIEVSTEKNKEGKNEFYGNIGANVSVCTPTPIYKEYGKTFEISLGKDGFETSTNYCKSTGISLCGSAYLEKTKYVNEKDVENYNNRVDDYNSIKENKIYKSNRCIREEVNHDYNDCIHPHDYNKEFGIPRNKKK